MSDYDRISALLTASQREYLRGESDVEPRSANERAIRARIRERLRATILDLSLLNSTIEFRDLERAFEDDWNPEETPPDEVLHVFNAISPALALIFDGASRASSMKTVEEGEAAPNESILNMFADFISDAIESIYVKRGISVESVSVDIDVEFGEEIRELSDRELSSLSKNQLDQLLSVGEITVDEYASALGEIYDQDIGVIEMERDSNQE